MVRIENSDLFMIPARIKNTQMLLSFRSMIIIVV